MLISEELSYELNKVINISFSGNKNDDNKIIEENFKLINETINQFKEDLQKFPKGTDGLDMKYYEDKHIFYNKYLKLCQKCKEILDIISISGYGMTDIIRIKIKDLCTFVTWNFPHGWKY